MYLKCIQLHVRSCGYPPSFVKHIASGPLATPSFSAIRPAVAEMRKRSAHVQLCPTLYFCKSLVNGSLTTHRISAQSAKPFPRYGKGAHLHVRTCRCTLSLVCVNCLANWSHNIPNFNVIRPAVPEIRKGVRTRARADAPTPESCKTHR